LIVHRSSINIMTEPDAKRTRAPRGSGPVTKAFLNALEAVPDTSRAMVAKAAMAMIKDELKSYPVSKKPAAKAKKAAARTAKAAGKTKAAAAAPAVKKRRGRKPATTSHAM
jgi:hypothetical protein